MSGIQTSSIPSLGGPFRRAADGVRLLQFGAIGGLCAILQLVLLSILTEAAGWGSMSNAVAFVLSAQCNFVLNHQLTWRDRRAARAIGTLSQWLSFNGVIAVAAVFNQLIYVAAGEVMPYLAAGAIGIGVTTVGKYIVADRWIFLHRRRGQRPGSSEITAMASTSTAV
jgi:putative flippase GtrA